MKRDSEIVELIYDIPLGRSDWHQVVEALRIEMDAVIAFLFLSRPEQEPILITATSSDESIWQQYEAHYCQIDPWNTLLSGPEYENNTIHYSSAFFTEKELRKTAYYNDFWKAYGLGETIGGFLTTESGITIQIGIPKGIGSRNYNDHEANLLRYYSYHICRAIELEGYIGNSLPQGIYESGLSAKFGLTKAEAQLTLTLLKTNSLQLAAESLYRSYHTVRTQLKSIFKKTETSSQIELIKRLISK